MTPGYGAREIGTWIRRRNACSIWEKKKKKNQKTTRIYWILKWNRDLRFNWKFGHRSCLISGLYELNIAGIIRFTQKLIDNLHRTRYQSRQTMSRLWSSTADCATKDGFNQNCRPSPRLLVFNYLENDIKGFSRLRNSFMAQFNYAQVEELSKFR